jgi:hypothetical protein
MRQLRKAEPRAQNSDRNEKLDYDKYNVPRVYKIDHPNKQRQNIKDYDYKGNF